MHDLRERANPDAHAIDPRVTHTETHAVTDDYGRQLYTVTTVTNDVRTFDERVTAELVRLVDRWQAHELRIELLEGTVQTLADANVYLARRVDALEQAQRAKVHVMAEDAWSTGA